VTQDQHIAVVPMLSVRNGARAVEFYKAAFGATALFRVENESGEVVAQLSVGRAEFWVADESPQFVRVEGGYRLIEIRTLTKLPGAKRS